ncbi:cyclase family protein [Sphingobacteriales bacterium UPWRP_1]|nr:metal-dependent hydrolase [Sphingobacteriales bacterium TSM_CSS]PSJ74554.1 cyclase family protein [Sphingobacteriales bacterium UPWRP_1]
MYATFYFQGNQLNFDLSNPIDISIPLLAGVQTANAFYAPFVTIEPVKSGSFIGDVALGGPVNFKNVHLNPHGNGTHTECFGHISPGAETLNQHLKNFFFIAALVSIYPQQQSNGDRLITRQQMEEALWGIQTQALIIRSLPNDGQKLQRHYSGTNPPYLHHEAAKLIAERKIEHLLLDLPSVDREEDGGLLLSHHAFWQYPNYTRKHCTITEMVYVPNEVKDGIYLLNLMITALELDASPSKPVLYGIMAE